MNQNDVILHGECMVFKSVIPSDAKKKTINDKHIIVANSETTGNHHVVDVVEGAEWYEKDGTLFLETPVETKIRCVIADRHDSITLPPGTYEFGTQQEYDPFAARMRNVAD